MKENTAYMAIQTTFTVAVGDFVMDAVNQMTPWLIVMFSVIMCDLITGCRKSMLMKEEVRFSRACRATMGKTVSYFSFVVMIVFINVSVGGGYEIDKWLVLFICFIEGCSIVGNLLKPKGININFIAAVGILLKKVFGIDREDSKDLLTKNKKKKS